MRISTSPTRRPWAGLAAVAILTAGGCGEDSASVPLGPTVPQPVVAPTAPSPPPSELPASPPSPALSESGVPPETVGQAATGTGEENSGSQPLPNAGESGSATGPRDVYAEISLGVRALSYDSIRVSWTVVIEGIPGDPSLVSLRRRKAPSGPWVSLSVSSLEGSLTDTGLEPATRYQYEMSAIRESDSASVSTHPLPCPRPFWPKPRRSRPARSG